MIGRIRDALAQLREAFADRPLEIEWPETDELAVAPTVQLQQLRNDIDNLPEWQRTLLACVRLRRRAQPPAADPDTEPVWEQQLLTRAMAADIDTFRVGYRADDADTWERLRRGDELLDQVAADLATARSRRTAPSHKAASGG